MGAARGTYRLSARDAERLKAAVPRGMRSALVTELIRTWLAARETDELRADLEEGCREMWELYADIAREWRPTDERLHGALAD